VSPATLFGELPISRGAIIGCSGAAVRSEAGGVLSGPGVISPGLDLSGTLNLDGVIGSLSINGALVAQNTAVTHLRVGGRLAGVEHDQLQVLGNFLPAGTLRVRLANGFTPALGDTFPLITFLSRFGTFPAVDLPPPAGSLAYAVGYGTTSVVMTVVAALPPLILPQLSNRVVEPGETAVFSVIASGSP